MRWARTLLAPSLSGSWDPKMAAALRRLRALGRRRRRPLSLTERSGAGTRGAMAGGRRGAMARPEQSSRRSPNTSSPLPRPLPAARSVTAVTATATRFAQLALHYRRLTPLADRGSR
ncbi:uncharacterized protein ACOB8E_015583 isoform 1-T11 [Sarcophilus harrisii]